MPGTMPRVPPVQPAPLSPDNLRALRHALSAGRLEARLGFGGAVLLLACSAPLGLALHGRPAGSDRIVLAALLATVLLFVCLLLRKLLRQRARLWRPLAEAMAGGGKQVTHGRLHALEAAGEGGLRYTVDGEVLHLWPLAGPFDGPGLAPGQRIDRLQHLAGTEIALHWLPIAPQQGLLLEAHYPEAPPATRRTRPSEDGDHRRAAWHARELILVLALALPAGTLPLAFAGGFDAGRLGLTLAIGLLTCGAIAALGWLQVRRRAGRGLRLATLTGPVTECFRTPRSGKHRPARHWYRVGGVLVCPGGRRSAPVNLGQHVDVEFLAGDGEADDVLVAFGPANEPPAGA